ncbi:hypothetical protein AKO1_003171 [Acrasis kona]|uniref:Uncharacterized protein n=1 Tax=Acrasis kona TaxID=1008807 RepID=A0AAW2Z721_9EUKA
MMFGFLWEPAGTGNLASDQMPHMFLLVEFCILIGVINFLAPLIFRWVVWWLAIRKNKSTRALKKMFEGADFTIDESHKFVAKSTWSCMFFSSLVPFIAPIWCALLLIIYYVDKFNILRRFRKPNSNDNTITRLMVTYFLPWAVIGHFCVAVKLYSFHNGPFLIMIIPLAITFGLYLISITIDLIMYALSYWSIPAREDLRDDMESICYSQIPNPEYYNSIQPGESSVDSNSSSDCYSLYN